jgi:Flp pilus assembly protein TadD
MCLFMLDDYAQAVKAQPDSANFHYPLGQAYLKIGQRREAEKELAKANKVQAGARQKLEERFSGRLPPPQAAPF